MADIIDMPKLSDTMTVGTLVKWLKKEGDAVKTGDMLAEVETDKATMELESFFDGTLLKIFTPAGSQVPIGAPLCAVGKPGETVSAPSAPTAASAAKTEESKPAAAAPAAGPEGHAAKASPPSGAASTAASAAGSPPPKPEAASGFAAPKPDSSGEGGPPRVAGSPGQGTSPAEAAPPSDARLRISPLARKLAAEKRVDPARVKGSGPGGRIVRADILAAASQPPAPAAGAAPESASGSAAAKPDSSGGGGPVPVSNIRAVIARRLVESKTQIPHFYLDIEIDAEPILDLRTQLNAALEKDGVKLSVNDFILKASAAALKRVPAVNASWEEKPGSQPAIRRHESAHVSFAVAIEDGLITPVIRDTNAKSLLAISAEVKSLAKLAKDKKLQPAQYTGGTFCVSNLGMYGIDRFSAIINPPNAAILAVGATVKKPVVKRDQLAIGHRMSLTLSCDHRVVDGATGAQYLAALRELLEKPVLFLL